MKHGDEARLSILKANVVEGHDVGVVEGAGEFYVALEALHQACVGA
jgi:hypothetical protein